VKFLVNAQIPDQVERGLFKDAKKSRELLHPALLINKVEPLDFMDPAGKILTKKRKSPRTGYDLNIVLFQEVGYYDLASGGVPHAFPRNSV
jgi:hypothetical protein